MTTITACPDKPNCVSSKAPDEDHFIKPLGFSGGGAEAMARLKKVMISLPRTRLVAEEGTYLKYEVTTRLLRFTDDVEFGLNEAEHVIDLRSASRVGHSDLGVNRKRIEDIRSKFDEAGS